MKLCGIYLITHIESGRQYVGQSRDINRRWKQHEKVPTQSKISRAIQKYGWTAFRAEVLEFCEQTSLSEAEARWVAHYNCMSPKGFNLTTGGEYCSMSEETVQKCVAFHTGRKRSEESKLRMSESAKLKIFTAEHIEKLTAVLNRPETKAKSAAARVGLKRSPAAVAKTVASNIGRKHTPEALEKMRKPKSAETKAKLSAAAKARKMTPERLTQLKMISAANVGRKNSPEHIAKTVAFHTGRKRSAETLARMSESKKALYAARRESAALAAIPRGVTGDLFSDIS